MNRSANDVNLNLFNEIDERISNLPPVAKKFRQETEAASAVWPAGSKQFPNYEVHSELLKLKTENAKLQSRLNALNQELTECKIRSMNEHQNYTRDKLEFESKTRVVQRQLSDAIQKQNGVETTMLNLKRMTENEKSKLLQNVNDLSCNNEYLERQLLDATLENQTKLQSAQDELLAEKRTASRDRLLAERLEKELQLCKSKNLGLENSLRTTKKQLSQVNRKYDEQCIAMRQWREENQLATVLRHDLQDLKALRRESSTLKEQLQRYKNLSENIALIKQEKTFLEEENSRTNSLLEKYVSENSELKMALCRQGQSPKSPTSEKVEFTPRRSLSDIDALSARCVQLKDELQEKIALVNGLSAELSEKEARVEELLRSPVAHVCKIEKVDSSIQTSSEEHVVDSLRAEIQSKNDHIASLMKKLGRTRDFDPETTCVVHLEQNPLSLAHEAHSKRLEANKILHLRVEELEKVRMNLVQQREVDQPCGSGFVSASHNDVTLNVQSRVEDMNKDKEISSLNAEISKLVEQRDRVAKKYQEMGSYYRDACFFLTGYDIKVSDEHLIKLRSAYERSPIEEPYFLIQRSVEGEYHLMANEYVENWRGDFVEKYLNNDNGFPAFFAAVTLRLYEGASESTPLNTVGSP